MEESVPQLTPRPNPFTTATPLSKALALILFVSLPFVGFYLGMRYQNLIYTQPELTVVLKSEKQSVNSIVGQVQETKQASISETINNGEKQKTYTNTQFGFTFSYPPTWDFIDKTAEVYRKDETLLIISVNDRKHVFGVKVWSNKREPPLLSAAEVKQPIVIDGRSETVSFFPEGYECYDMPEQGCDFFGIPVKRGNYTYELNAAGEAKTVTPIYQKILSTFKFLP